MAAARPSTDVPRSWPLPAFACFGVFGLFWGSWGALLPALQAQARVSDAQLGLALLLVAGAALPAMIASGRLIDRWGHRSLAPAMAAFAVSSVLPGLAHSPAALYLAGLVMGAASGTMDVTMNAAVAVEEDRQGRRFMHAAHALFSLGVFVGGISVGLARSAGATPPQVTVAAGALSLLTALAIARPRRGEPRVEPPHEEAVPDRLLLTAPLAVLGLLCGLAYLLEGSLESWSAIHIEHTLGGGPALGGLGPAVFAASAVMGRLGGQALAARVHDRPLLAAAGALGAGGTLIAAAAPSPPVALAGFFLAGAGIAVAAPTVFSLTGRVVRAGERGRAMASVTTIAYVGFVLGPSMVGAIAGASTLRLGLAAAAAVALLLVPLARLAPVRSPAPARGP